MKIIIPASFVMGLCLLPLSHTASAEEVLDYTLGMRVGVRDVELQFDANIGPSFGSPNISPDEFERLSTGGTTKFDFDETLYLVGFSGTLIYDRFSLTGLLELTAEEGTDMHTELVANPGSPLPSDSTDRATDLSQFNYSITLGYQVWRGLSIFSGYQHTELELNSKEYNFLLGNKDQTYEEEGLFVGGGYSWTFGSKGSLFLGVAYAYLDADLSESNVSTDPIPGQLSTIGEFAFDGTSNGLSYSAQWAGPLADHWVYSVGLKYQKYTSDNNTTELETYSSLATIAPTVISDLDSEHTDTTFSVGIAYMFD